MDNFLKENKVTMVEFFAPWCGHCKNLAPEYKKLAKALNGIIKIGAVDADQEANKPLAGKYGVQGFPTLKIFVNGKPKDYQGARTANAMRDALLDAVKSANDSGSADSGSSSGSSKKSSSSGQKAASGKEVELNDSNFSETVYKSTKPAILFFYAPWCGHCQSLKPEFTKVANKLHSKVDFFKYDADANKGQSAEYGIQGYPTLFWFDRNTGGRSRAQAKTYQGGRSEQEMLKWINEQLAKPVNLDSKVYEVYNAATFSEYCKGSSLICAIAFLPMVEDSKAEGRNKYIEELLETQKTLAKRLLDTQIVWVAGQTQLALENTFGVDGNYPSIVVISNTKDVFGKYVGPFLNKDIVDYVWGVKNRPRGLVEFTMPQFNENQKWDGKDVEVDDSAIDDDFLADIIGQKSDL